MPHFDVVHRGMGPDAHTASLFPGEPLIDDREGIAAAVFVPQFNQWRVTLLPGVLLAAKHTVFLVAGADKAEAVRAVFKEEYDPEEVPGADYYIAEYQETAFDSYSFTVTEAGNEKRAAGRRAQVRVQIQPQGQNVTMPSQLQVVRNYQNAARAAGGQVLFDTGDATTLRLTKGGKEVWFSVQVANVPSGLFITMIIIEKQAMQQDVTLDAKALAGDIGEAGRVAVYGIYFDTGKSELKPESGPALIEIGKLLKAEPG